MASFRIIVALRHNCLEIIAQDTTVAKMRANYVVLFKRRVVNIQMNHTENYVIVYVAVNTFLHSYTTVSDKEKLKIYTQKH